MPETSNAWWKLFKTHIVPLLGQSQIRISLVQTQL